MSIIKLKFILVERVEVWKVTDFQMRNIFIFFYFFFIGFIIFFLSISFISSHSTWIHFFSFFTIPNELDGEDWVGRWWLFLCWILVKSMVEQIFIFKFINFFHLFQNCYSSYFFTFQNWSYWNYDYWYYLILVECYHKVFTGQYL